MDTKLIKVGKRMGDTDQDFVFGETLLAGLDLRQNFALVFSALLHGPKML